jgi:uncharacterized protein (TIGR02145 family)
VKLAGVVGPRVKAGYKFKIKECAGGSNEAHIAGVQGKLTSELFLKLDLKGIKLVDKIIPKNWSKEWTLPVGEKHVFPDTVCRYSGNNLNARASSLVKVKVLGSGGKPSRNAIVIFRPQDGDTVVPSSARTDANGIAQARWEPGQNSDVHQLYAYVYDCEQNPIKGAPVVFTAYEFEGCASSTLKLKYLVTGNTLTLQAEGGRPPYTYSVNGGNFVSLDRLPVLSALSGHVLSVKDDFGCIRTITYGHIDNMNCAWSDLGLDAEYSNGALILQGIEGTPPYKYSLDGNEFITSNMFPSLSPGVYTAYVRDYAGCEYSREVTVEEDEIIDMTPIALQACPDAPTVTDYDGNIYNTVQIGEQCWMRENLRTTHYSNGTAIPLGGSYASSIAPYYYDTLSSIPLDQRGYHYNWPAAMHGASSSNANPSGVQGICPTGWHLPSDAEWTQLTNYVRSHSEYTCGGSSDNIAKALASTTGWNLATGMSSSISSCEVGNNLSANNSTGFSAVPSGSWNNGLSNAGYFAYFWSSTEYDATGVSLRRLGFNLANVNRNYFDKNGGLSVRCLRNGSGYATHAPTVTTDSVTSLAATSATLNGSITNPDSVPITAQGFEWKAADGGSYTQVSATGSTMSYDLTGLTPATTYTYRAFVTTGFGTTYGSEVNFTTTSGSTAVDGQPCPGTPNVTDYDGNIYNTVQIGNQCWMKENLRTTHYADNTLIPAGDTYSNTDPYRYAPDNDEANVAVYGYLYNWPAMMHGASSSSANPSGVQGICPTGWHVPSDAEWTQLTDYVSSQSQYVCGSNNTYIAKALAATTGWIYYHSGECYPGDQSVHANNATGFSALPAGRINGSYYDSFGSNALFWSATERYGNTAYFPGLYYGGANVGKNDHFKNAGFSVRCLRDGSGNATHAPTVTTDSATSHAATSATLNGSIANPNSVPITAQGFEWKATDGGSYTQVFASGSTMSYALTGLTPATTYTYRAFVTTTSDTIYGNEVNFTTTTSVAFTCGTSKVADVDGNMYNTIQLGYQCWMKENLRTTHYADGTSIPVGGSNSSDANPYYYDYTSSNFALTERGLLYNWPAVMHGSASSGANPSGVQGVCPMGWHLPSEAEWSQMIDCVSCRPRCRCDNSDGQSIAKALSSSIGWDSSPNTCAVGNTPENNNATGFSILPAGYYEYRSYGNSGNRAYFWTATDANRRTIEYNYAKVSGWHSPKQYGYSVRCVRDDSGIAVQAPTMTTRSVTDVTQTSAILNATIVNPDNVPIENHGFEWKTTIGGTYTQVFVSDSTMSYALAGLTAGIGYTYRAFVTSVFGIIYGDEMTFTTVGGSSAQNVQTCPGTPTVTDYDGNTYNTVQIGQQCWMRENLRTTHYADGTSIPYSSNNNLTDPYNPDPYYYGDDFFFAPSTSLMGHGLRYNWPALMHGAASSSANPSGVQGVCPTGWHVPSDAEWTQLTDYVSSQSEYICDSNSANIAKALASTSGWNTTTNNCAVGNDLSANNATGFDAFPAGEGMSENNDYGKEAHFWSCTKCRASETYNLVLYHTGSIMYRSCTHWFNGYSVRCLRD